VVTLDRTSLVVNHSGGDRPHFILRPRKKVTVTDYVFRDTGETRLPDYGEWFRSGGMLGLEDYFLQAMPGNLYTKRERIYTREEITREIEVEE
jgi:hypothetical protein